jgi:phosphoenolpyruvate synthase/pyruvate phosphate dikinase/NAD(P)-dependent dehydrogenase (short-subunit alcohol dehydrogenase family)
MNLLKEKIAVITGGTRGLGFSIAREFIQEGAVVVIASRSLDSVEKAVRDLRNLGGQAEGITCHTGELDHVEALAAFACEKFGGFDIWVNNAGISCPTGPTVHVPPEMVISLIQTNIIGAYYGSIVAMRHFVPRGKGKLINMVGKGERRPVPLHNAYASSRSWVRSFTLAMAQEYKATGVGVFLLNPGMVETDMLQNLHFIEGYEYKLKVLCVVKRVLANPPEVPARKAVWLASAATDGKTGLYSSSIGPGRMLKGLTGELSRVILRQAPPPYNPHVELIKPALNFKLPEKASKRKRGERNSSYIFHLDGKKLPDSVGNKAKNLWRLKKRGFLVPDTYILTWDAFLAYRQKGDKILEEIKPRLEQVLDPGQDYAIRSSADIEDSREYSFAGQFVTVLDVRGIDRVLDAIRRIWSETQTDSLQSYGKKTPHNLASLRMAVIIQKMVKPVVSGVSFSVNPITSLDEITVEAVRGRGDLLVQEGVTPLRWVMKWGNWIEQPESSVVALDMIHQVVNETQKISKTFKREVDLEWVYDGENLYWVQMRDITAMVKAEIYSNKIAKEMTPGMVKPLDWSVVIPIPSAVWLNFITQVIGKNNISPNSLVKAFHYRTYHNLGVFGQIFEILGMPRESLEIMMGVAAHGAGKPKFKPGPKFIRLLPRVMRFVWDKWRFAKKAGEDFPKLQAEAKRYSLSPSVEYDGRSLYKIIDELVDLNTRTTYNTVLSIMLMQIYNGVFRSLLKKVDIDLDDFNLTEGMKELQEYDPNEKLAALNHKYLALDENLRQEIKRSNYQTLKTIAGIEDFHRDLEKFLEEFGHMSDRTGVFDTIPWRETPDLILGLILDFQKPEESMANRIRFKDLELKGMHSIILKTFYHRARQFRLFREMYSSLFTYTLMLFRVYYLALGDRLVERGLLVSREDIYYLYDNEIRAFIDGKRSGADFEHLVIQRKQEMVRCEPAILPQIIYGNEAPPLIVQSDKRLTGTPTSRGYYTGKIKVVRGISDFNKLAQGDVLVIPHSDVGWLPLFAKAGAVIAEAGGMLSHSSIIAREYGIPAVVSVNGALQLTDDLLVSIDGYKGVIHIHVKI